MCAYGTARRACGSAAWSVVSNQGPQAARCFGRAQLTKRLGFDLADALARNVVLLTDLLQGVLALAADPKSQPNYLLFPGRERLQDARRLIANVGLDYSVDRRSDPAVLDQTAQRGLAIAAGRSFEGHRVASNGLQLLDLFHRNVHPAADLLVGWPAVQFLVQLPGRAEE